MVKPASYDSRAKCRAMAADEESYAAGLRAKASRLKGDAAKRLLIAARHRDAAARAYYEAAFEFSRGESAKGTKREVDAKRHISAAEYAVK